MQRRNAIGLSILAALGALAVIVINNRDSLASLGADAAEKFWTLPSAGEPYRAIIQAAADATGVPFDLLSRDLWQESRFNPTAYNPSGASGIAQLIPRFYPGVDGLDPAQAIPAQAQSYAAHFNRFGTWSKALAAYDWGEGKVDKVVRAYGDNWLLYAPTETRKYVGQILTDVPLEALPVGALV